MNAILRRAALAAALVLAPLSARAQAPDAPGGGAGQTPPPVQFPATPAGAAARALVEALNAPEEEAVRAWTRDHLADTLFLGWTPERYAALLLKLRRQSGGVEVTRVREMGSDVGVFVRGRAGGQRLGIEVGSYGAHGKVSYLGMHPMAAPVRYDWPSAKLDDAGVASAVEGFLNAAAADDRWSGVVLLARGDRVLLRRAYGMADRDRGVANTPETRISTGSIGKLATAVAVAQLVERGRLRFTDTLASVLPGYPNAEAARRVTVHQLLTHTAGIADPFGSGLMPRGTRLRTPRDYFPYFAAQPLTHEPGAAHSYTNGGYAVLAAVVEEASGMPFARYLREHVYAPAGMRMADDGPWAYGYSHAPEVDPMGIEARRPNSWLLGDEPPRTSAAGFGFGHATADDLFRLARALRTNRLLSPEMTEVVVTGKVPLGPGAPVRYGYGIYDDDWDGVHVRGHSGGGGSSGIGAQLEILWDAEWTLVMLGNYDLEEDVRPLAGQVLDFLVKQVKS